MFYQKYGLDTIQHGQWNNKREFLFEKEPISASYPTVYAKDFGILAYTKELGIAAYAKESGLPAYAKESTNLTYAKESVLSQSIGRNQLISSGLLTARDRLLQKCANATGVASSSAAGARKPYPIGLVSGVVVQGRGPIGGQRGRAGRERICGELPMLVACSYDRQL